MVMHVSPVILHINHHFGGGTETHVDRLTAFLSGKSAHLVLQSSSNKEQMRLSRVTGAQRDWVTFDVHKHFEPLCKAVRDAGVTHIHIHQLFGVPLDLRRLIDSLELSFDFTVHDYHTVCPRVHLKDWENRYCREPGEHVCNSCMKRSPDPPDPADPGAPDIVSYRQRYDWVFWRARFVICPSRDVASRVLGYYPAARLVVAPHDQLELNVDSPIRARPLAPDQPLRIAILGNLTSFKGAATVAQCAQIVQRQNAPLSFRLIGWSSEAMPWAPEAPLTQTGRYRPEKLPGLLQESAPNLVWFSVPVPETFSYTLSEAFSAGLPVVVPNLGVFPERVAGRPWSWVVPWDTTPEEWISFFLKIRENNFFGPIPPPMICSESKRPKKDMPPNNNFYQGTYLKDWAAVT